MQMILRVAILIGLLPVHVAAQSLPNEIIGHKIRVPGDKVDGTTARAVGSRTRDGRSAAAAAAGRAAVAIRLSQHVGATDEIKARVKEWRGVITMTARDGNAD